MSVNACYRRVTPDELDRLRRDPVLVDRFFGIFEHVSDDEYEPALAAYDRERERLAAAGRFVDVMNDHQALNFLLTGSHQGGGPPLGAVVGGGQPLSEVDVDFGTPRVLSPGQVREVAAALTVYPNRPARL